MSMAPLLNAPLQIQLHAFAAMGAFFLGILQFVAPKGTIPHRTVGWVWVGLMMVVAVSSFWIHGIRMVGPFGPIHLLSILALTMVPLGVWHARRHKVSSHRQTMIWVFVGALLIAGGFTFLPGRIMHRVAFGG